jgi:NAD(P)H-dependent FMN reductase
MARIIIVSASIRIGRASDRVALYFKNFLEENKIAEAEIMELAAYNFPIFDERLRYQEHPTPAMLEVSEKIKSADGVIIVTPEYNGGYPASLKNFVDLLYDEWFRKPTVISTVSSGAFGGSQVITSLQFTLWKMKIWTVPAMFPVPRVQDEFDVNGVPKDKPIVDKRASVFIAELMWCIEAKRRMEV